MTQTYMPRRKNPFQADNAGPASGPSQVTMAASGALAGASVDQGEGLAEQMNQRMAKQFGIGFPGAEELSGVQVHYNSSLPS